MLGINGTLFVFAISFIAFVFILKQIFWDKVTAVKVMRDNDVLMNVEEAKIKQEQSEKIIQDIESRISTIRKKQAEEMAHVVNTTKNQCGEQYQAVVRDLESDKIQRELMLSTSKKRLLEAISDISAPTAENLLSILTKR